MPELDHLIVASPDLEEGIAHIEALTGARAVAGGPHPGMGSHNALLTFDHTTYFEVIAIDPNQPDPKRPRPFDLDNAVGPRLAGYAIHPAPGESLEQVAEQMRTVGIDPGQVMSMSRVKPDGDELHWRLTNTPGPRPAVATVPFVIDWGGGSSPAASLPSMGSLLSLQVTNPDGAIRSALDSLGLAIQTVDGAPGLVAVVETARGRVEIS